MCPGAEACWMEATPLAHRLHVLYSLYNIMLCVSERTRLQTASAYCKLLYLFGAPNKESPNYKGTAYGTALPRYGLKAVRP